MAKSALLENESFVAMAKRALGEEVRSVEIDGVSYEAEVGTITRAYLGYEDHGLLIAQLSFEGSGWGQVEPARTRTPKALDSYLREVLRTLAVDSWDQVVGQKVLTLRKTLLGRVEGFTDPTESRSMIFDPPASGEQRADLEADSRG